MLKDVEDSKRANNGVHSELAKVASSQSQVSYFDFILLLCLSF